jgi:hypothetical protein
MRKEVGWIWYHSIGLDLSPSHRNFSKECLQIPSCERLKLLSEPCVCHLKTIIVSQYRYTVGALWKNLWNLHATWWIQTSLLVLCLHSKYCKEVFVIWKDSWCADFYRRLKHRGGCTIPLFQLSVWFEKCVTARHYADIWKQLSFSNNRNRVRGVVLNLSQDGASTPISLKISARTA